MQRRIKYNTLFSTRKLRYTLTDREGYIQLEITIPEIAFI